MIPKAALKKRYGLRLHPSFTMVKVVKLCLRKGGAQKAWHLYVSHPFPSSLRHIHLLSSDITNQTHPSFIFRTFLTSMNLDDSLRAQNAAETCFAPCPHANPQVPCRRCICFSLIDILILYMGKYFSEPHGLLACGGALSLHAGTWTLKPRHTHIFSFGIAPLSAFDCTLMDNKSSNY